MTRQTRITTFARFFDACAQLFSTNEDRIRIWLAILLGGQPFVHAEFARNDGRAISGGVVLREGATALLLQPQGVRKCLAQHFEQIAHTKRAMKGERQTIMGII